MSLNILVRGRGPIERKLRVPLPRKINWLGLNSRAHLEEVALEILVRKGERTNQNHTRNTGKGYPTVLFILFYIIVMKKFGSKSNDEKFIT